jgi:hypothetical protein
MQTALDYLLERLLAEPSRVQEVDAKTTERPGEKLTSHEENRSGTRPASHGEEGARPSNVSRD